MAKHSKIGRKGEELASEFLLNKGYIVLHRNWRHGSHELDIVAQKDGLLVIAEVKTRKSYAFGFPEESVNRRKQAHLKSAAAAYADQYRDYPNYRFDIISICMNGELVKEIMHFEDAFR